MFGKPFCLVEVPKDSCYLNGGGKIPIFPKRLKFFLAVWLICFSFDTIQMGFDVCADPGCSTPCSVSVFTRRVEVE